MHAKVSVTESQFPGILAEILGPKLLLKHELGSWVTQELMKMFLWNVTGSSDRVTHSPWGMTAQTGWW